MKRHLLVFFAVPLLSACFVSVGDENSEAKYRCESKTDCLSAFQCLSGYCSKMDNIPLADAGAEDAQVGPADSQMTTDSSVTPDAMVPMDTGAYPDAMAVKEDSGEHPDAAAPGIPDSGVYPMSGNLLLAGSVMPPVYWTSVYDYTGVTTGFGMEEFYTSSLYSRFNSVAFIVVAVWEPNSPNYIRQVHNMVSTLNANNMMIVYLSTDNDLAAPASGQEAHDFVTQNQATSGLRVGDGETMLHGQQIGVFRAFIPSIPRAIVVRKSDMLVLNIPNQPDLAAVSANPENY